MTSDIKLIQNNDLIDRISCFKLNHIKLHSTKLSDIITSHHKMQQNDWYDNNKNR